MAYVLAQSGTCFRCSWLWMKEILLMTDSDTILFVHVQVSYVEYSLGVRVLFYTEACVVRVRARFKGVVFISKLFPRRAG